GDGTTTATVLAQAIFENGLRMISSGEDSVVLRKSIEVAVGDLIESLKTLARPINTKKELEQIASISCNGEEETAKLITDAIDKVGNDGSVIVEEAKGYNSDLTIVEGVQVDRGYLSPYFITDNDKMCALLENTYVFICNRKLETMKDIIKPLEHVLDSGKPILVVANDIENEALQGLVVNRVKGNLKVCAIKSPGFGNARYDMLHDLACLTGGKVFDVSDDLNDFKHEDLGFCKKIIVKRSTSLFVASNKTDTAVKQRIQQIKDRMSQTDLEENEYDVLEYRCKQLTGGVAILRVGAATEAEMIERRDRVDDALHATRAALQEGIVPGGGIALAKAASTITPKDSKHSSGYSIIKAACAEPLKQIVRNTGRSSDLVAEKVLSAEDSSYGYDARNEKFGNMFEMGIIDPLKVVRCALQNAASAATLLLTADCAMVEEITKQE
ncbi:MAG TPA: molecular chaperone GroEL, partial [Balneola sp.]|nr:molecular chaperone GroEL [Balneola sp.]